MDNTSNTPSTAIDFQALRIEYSNTEFGPESAASDPAEQFQRWLQEAIQGRVPEANAFSLATVGADGSPSARMVLLKANHDGKLTFFTNYQSEKGTEIARYQQVAAVFFWQPLSRQVRIKGAATQIPRSETERYFRSRPRSAQIGASISPQSTVIADREWLQSAYDEFDHAHSDGEIECPRHWGGFEIQPTYFEFWQGRRSRLHDRLAYSWVGTGWQIRRLAP